MNPINFEAVQNVLGPGGFLISFEFWYGMRFVAILLSIIFLAASIWLLVIILPSLRNRLYILEGSRAYKAPQRRFTLEEEQKITTRKKWDAIIEKAERAGEGGYAIAIIEADSLIESTLGRMGFVGKSIAQRLRSVTPSELPSINDVWEAHKVRNKIAHETDFSPTKEETMRALAVYKKALEELKAI